MKKPTTLKHKSGKISVISVCYNETDERIRCTFNSIISQDYSSVEFVVIDGGSRKDTLASLAFYRDRIDIFISEPDNGLYDAMNKGIRLATGDWIIFMNIGDSFHKTVTLSSIMNVENIDNISLIFGSIIGSDNKHVSSPNRLSNNYLFNQTICHQAILARRNVFDETGLFDTSYQIIADRDWLLRFYRTGSSYIHLPITICDSASGSVCSDYKKMDQEIRQYQLNNFTFLNRALYTSIWLLTRTYRRIKSCNLAVPVRLKDKYWYPISRPKR